MKRPIDQRRDTKYVKHTKHLSYEGYSETSHVTIYEYPLYLYKNKMVNNLVDMDKKDIVISINFSGQCVISFITRGSFNMTELYCCHNISLLKFTQIKMVNI